MSANESLNKRLERIRSERKLTIAALARLIDVPESTYREWENGKGMRIPPFQKLSNAPGVSVSELVTGQKPGLQAVVGDLNSIETDTRELLKKDF